MSTNQYNIERIWSNFLSDGSDYSLSYLYNYYIDKLYSYGIHLGFDSEMCKDAIQDIFIKIHSTRLKLSYIENPTSFLFRSFKNRLIDLSRRSKNEMNFDISQSSFTIDITVLDTILDIERADILKYKVESMLSKLSDTQREAIYLRYIHEMEYSEISKKLNIKQDSARKLIHRAITSLRDQNLNEVSDIALMVILLYYL